MRYSTNREIDALLQHATRVEGASVERTGGGHLRVRFPSGALVYMASTPSDRRATLNIKTQLRRAARGQPQPMRQAQSP